MENIKISTSTKNFIPITITFTLETLDESDEVKKYIPPILNIRDFKYKYVTDFWEKIGEKVSEIILNQL